MPPRFLVAGIVAFWFATTAYVAYRDVWPRLFASGPPPITIELADEAKQNIPAKWTLLRNGEKIGKLTTLMKYHDANDTFQFTYRYTQLTLEQADVTFVASEAISDIWLTRSGALKEQVMTAKVKALYRGVEVAQGTLDVRGTVANGMLTGRAELNSNLLKIANDLNPIPVKSGQPLNPLQPVNRITGLHGGKEWLVHLSNPLSDALGELLDTKLAEQGIRLRAPKKQESIVAQVSRATELLDWQRESVACWVIEYRRAEPFARTWVRATDGKVLRQELFEAGEMLMFDRED